MKHACGSAAVLLATMMPDSRAAPLEEGDGKTIRKSSCAGRTGGLRGQSPRATHESLKPTWCATACKCWTRIMTLARWQEALPPIAKKGQRRKWSIGWRDYNWKSEWEGPLQPCGVGKERLLMRDAGEGVAWRITAA
eukprot:4396805-Amphidinium_carterae.1